MSSNSTRRAGEAQQTDGVARPPVRTSIAVQGARVHNLKNVSVEIPRDQLTVVTGLSGSGKSSLAFDTVYAEGQRRYMESLSSYAKRFIAQVEKPDVDFVYGLSPVVSIEQKTIGRNPRSTVGTLTDIASYLNLLFATIGEGYCPYTDEPVPVKTASQILESVLKLPEGAEVELRAPIFQVYGEDPEFIFNEIRKLGCRYVDIHHADSKQPVRIDLAENVPDALPGDPKLSAVVDRFVLVPGVEKQLKAGIEHALRVGDSLMSAAVVGGTNDREARRFAQAFGSVQHALVYGDIVPDFFMFNNPESACRTCGGIGTDKRTHPDLLITNPERSLRDGCFLRDAFNYRPDNHRGYTLYSMSQKYGFDIDAPWQSLSDEARDLILYGTRGEPLQLEIPPDAKVRKEGWLRRPYPFQGIAGGIERHYRWYRQRDVANSGMEAWLDRVMVEHICPDCDGSRLRATRLKFLVNGKTIDEFGQMNFDELRPFLDTVQPTGDRAAAGAQIVREVSRRLDLLLGIGLDYLNFNRASGTLSGGEAQRIRLSTQIGSGLMGMLYVLDEPSIGLHPKDNVKMIDTLRSLRDLGNTVIVVEHDEDTIRAADHVLELGPGPGIHGGEVVASGTLADILECSASPTGQYLSGRRRIETPSSRRETNGKALTILGASANNLKAVDVDIPLGQFVCVSGASGSGKSTLINEILYKELWKRLVDSRSLSGAHDDLKGVEHLTRVINIDQSPIGRNSRSNPSTYVGFYDQIRTLFAKTDTAQDRGYKPGRFSFNVKGGRCEECQGEGVIATKLYFMPDVEVVCGACKGQRFNAETLEVTHKDKNIADVLDMSIEEGVEFFADLPNIGRKIKVLNDLGLGYLTLGQSATTLSGGEAQRIKLATELAKLQRRGHILYILDEPTTGLHLADIRRLLDCLHRLVDAGHTVLVIEHHLDVIKTADHVIDLGPEGGRGGGEVVAKGTPEDIAASPRSYTGQYLRAHL
ncbi:MAG: excinuclease ABC subunit UvrA [Gammaproteobacteria bacterium]|nr:excinuclease ABC subunit UvrA [Gammaproteobacteria bacterium]